MILFPVFLIVLLGGTYVFLSRNPRPSSRTKIITTLPEALDVLRNSTLTSRALPNVRLISAFGIDNSFTTTSSSHHKAFISHVSSLLRQTPSSWAAAASFARSYTATHLTPTTLLVPFLRRLTLTVIIRLFFPSAHISDQDSVSRLGDLIHTLWISSKTGGSSAADKASLAETLQKIFDSPDPGPLNILLPAYETLWRVVLRCFLEVQFRGSEQRRRAFARFSREPDEDEFADVEKTVRDVLEMYPPTRRIYRQTEEGMVAVDVEKVGGLVFGGGKFVCPAGRSFAPRLIAVLVGCVVERVGEGAEWRGGEEGDGVGEGRLRAGREGYENGWVWWKE